MRDGPLAMGVRGFSAGAAVCGHRPLTQFVAGPTRNPDPGTKPARPGDLRAGWSCRPVGPCGPAGPRVPRCGNGARQSDIAERAEAGMGAFCIISTTTHPWRSLHYEPMDDKLRIGHRRQKPVTVRQQHRVRLLCVLDTAGLIVRRSRHVLGDCPSRLGEGPRTRAFRKVIFERRARSQLMAACPRRVGEVLPRSPPRPGRAGFPNHMLCTTVDAGKPCVQSPTVVRSVAPAPFRTPKNPRRNG
jgi:hypothetical protein